jgi:HPt (histidine-containing phosphotransfer) domain-containing protein
MTYTSFIPADASTASATSPVDSLADLPGYEEIRQSWRAGLDAQLLQLQGFVASGALAAASMLSHAVRGTSASFGYTALARLAADIEAASRRGDSAAASAAMVQLLQLDELAHCSSV